MLKRIFLILIPIIVISLLSLLYISKHNNNDIKNPIQNTSSERNGNKNNYSDLLKSEGFQAKEVDTARMYVNRITMELNELATSNKKISVTKPETNNLSEFNSSNIYSEILSKIDEEKATYLMLKLKDELKDIEYVFDEYLLSLQLDIDLELYIKDKKSYEQKKLEKLAGKNPNEFINVEVIERKTLENFQKQNELSKPNDNNLIPNSNQINPLDAGNGVSNPNQIDPNPNSFENIQPQDPSAEINKKIRR